MSDPTAAEVRNFIAAGLECTHLEVEGDGRHFFATIVAAEFDGKTRVQRHQRVYAALGDRMRAQIHALSMKTLTLAEWQALAAQATAQPHHH
jgi:acid stress-induced BolA-like protein IbaG/YrbA